MDGDGEAALIDAIGRLKARGTTVILVAHRPSLLVHVDRLLVMHDGAGVLFGARDEVLPRLMVSGADARRDGGRVMIALIERRWATRPPQLAAPTASAHRSCTRCAARSAPALW